MNGMVHGYNFFHARDRNRDVAMSVMCDQLTLGGITLYIELCYGLCLCISRNLSLAYHAPISCCMALNRLDCNRNIQPLMDRAEELSRPSTQQDPSNNITRLWWIEHKQDCLQQPAGADDRVGTIRVQLSGVQQQHATSLSAKKSIHPQPVLMKWDIAVGEAAFYEVNRLTRFHKRGPFDMAHVLV
ncbi:hypothetical protein CAPTEDRAFT_197195 [Capitella teleta]|uniref:Uncharacterized protein n=1 Tax=Capitella teleta TaxID=283909 RepID=R7UC65_CAPTE|nr:hypothetical protein CAPTEDRAFT_197195 [Capitella teleta]|eukprot:ELU03940.1 hypothetical protein CAPTEDRAFT_197195 [Capitella teleta]